MPGYKLDLTKNSIRTKIRKSILANITLKLWGETYYEIYAPILAESTRRYFVVEEKI